MARRICFWLFTYSYSKRSSIANQPAIGISAVQTAVEYEYAEISTQLSCTSAARTVFSSNIAMVNGPTPPGTGVMAEATWLTASKSTSPTR